MTELGIAEFLCPPRLFCYPDKKNVDAQDIGEPSGLAFGKPKDRLRDAVLRTTMPGHDGETLACEDSLSHLRSF